MFSYHLPETLRGPIVTLVVIASLYVHTVHASQPGVQSGQGHIFGLSEKQLESIDEEFLHITGRNVASYVDNMPCTTDWKDLVQLENSVEQGIFGPLEKDIMSGYFYYYIQYKAKAPCYTDMFGRNFLFGLKAATVPLRTQEKVLNTLPGMNAEKAKIRGGIHCEMITFRDFNVLVKPFLDILGAALGNDEREKFQDYITAVIVNKLKVFNPRTAAPQLANSTHGCMDETFIPMVTTYMVQRLEDQDSKSSNRQLVVRNLDIEHEYNDHLDEISGRSEEELQNSMERFIEDDEAKKDVLDNLHLSSTRFSRLFSRRAPCHPICRKVIGATRMFSHAKLVACCSQCFGSSCKMDKRFSSLLSYSNIQTPTKTYPYRVKMYTLKP